jgi:hypothetical protein
MKRMKNVTMPKGEDNSITIHVDPSKVGRGHAFMACLSRGGRHQVQRFKKPRTMKERDW